MDITQSALSALGAHYGAAQGALDRTAEKPEPDRAVLVDFARPAPESGALRVDHPDPYAPSLGFVEQAVLAAAAQTPTGFARPVDDPMGEIRTLTLLAQASQGYTTATAAGMVPSQPMLDGTF